MKANINQIYELLFVGNRVTLPVESEKKAHNIRVSLARCHAKIVAANLSNESLCMDWKEDSRQAVFWLGQRRFKRPQNIFEFSYEPKETTDSEPVSAAMGNDPRFFGTSNGEVHEENATAANPSGEEEENCGNSESPPL